MTRSILIIFICLFAFTSKAQKTVITHPKIGDITFKNPKLKAFSTSQDFRFSNLLEASLHMGEYSSDIEIKLMQNAVNQFVDKELKPLYNPKKATKTLVKIQQKIDEKYFKTFNPAALLQDALSVGDFNCVSNATLNAHILDRLGVPFYMEADGNCFFINAEIGDGIQFGIDGLEKESLDGNTAYYDQFAEMIHSLGVISDLDLLTTSSSKIYEEYNDEPDFMRAKDLLAMHAVLVSGTEGLNGDPEASYNYAKLGDYLYPTYSTSVIMLTQGAVLLQNQDFSSEETTKIITEIHGYNNKFLNHEYLVAAIYGMHEKMENSTFIKQYDKLVKLNLPDSTIEAMKWHIYESKSLDFYNKALLDSAYRYAKLAYAKSPKDLENQRLYYNRFLGTYTRKSIEDLQVEASSIFAKHPTLKENPYFHTLRQNLTLIEASKQIDNNKYTEALQTIRSYEDLAKSKKGDLKAEEVNILKTYGRLAIFYFSTNNESKALELINKALEIYPNSSELLYKKEMIISD